MKGSGDPLFNESGLLRRYAPRNDGAELLLIVLILFTLSLNPLSAKKNKDFNKVIKASSKSGIYDIDQNIPRSKLDVAIEDMIHLRLGDQYRRTNVYDLYPQELPEKKARELDNEDQVKLMDYYDYARKDLEKLNQSKFLKVIQLDFNLDGTKDSAVIVHDIKHDANYLVVMNRDKVLYLDEFNASHLELIHAGHYPTNLIYQKGKKRITISTPAIRLASFDGVSTAFYYDKVKSKWASLELND